MSLKEELHKQRSVVWLFILFAVMTLVLLLPAALG
jgi:hypothetical protein